VLRRERAYFADNAARMDDPHFVAAQLPIGSGAVESLCKTLIEARVKGAGMRWTRAGLQAVVTLRAVRASGDGAAFWATHPLRARLRLWPPARPRRRMEAVAPVPESPDADLRPPALSAPVPPEPPPVPASPATPASAGPAHRPAATHVWRRAPIGRARCA